MENVRNVHVEACAVLIRQWLQLERHDVAGSHIACF